MNGMRQMPLYAAYLNGEPVLPGDVVVRRRKDRDIPVTATPGMTMWIRPTGVVATTNDGRATVRWSNGPREHTTIQFRRLRLIRRQDEPVYP